VRAGAAIAALLLAASGASAQNAVLFSPDITATLGPVLPAVVTDEGQAFDNSAGSVFPFVPAVPLPPQVEVAGFDLLPSGDRLIAVDVTVALPGLPPAMPAEPRDVVSYNSVTGFFTNVFDGSAVGVPANAHIDALATDSVGDLLLSFDTSVTLPGVGAVDDEDVVVFSGGTFAMVFDGSANGVAAGLDLDAANRVIGSDVLQVSFDGSGAVAGIPFDDEDVLDFDLVTTTYAMFADASLSDPLNWPAADLVALPEPGGAAMLAGAALTALLARARRRRPS
jgi:hypothetical protein